jgi:hypothetical protein
MKTSPYLEYQWSNTAGTRRGRIGIGNGDGDGGVARERRRRLRVVASAARRRTVERKPWGGAVLGRNRAVE